MQSQMHKCMNSKYRNKSEIYHDAAVELIKGDYLFSPIPHIAYYSCLLLMSHIWFVEKQHSITELQTKDNGEYTNKVHVILANKIKELVIENFKKTDVTIGDEFGKKLAKWKKLRVKADYKDEDITKEDSQKAIEISERILSILNKLK